MFVLFEGLHFKHSIRCQKSFPTLKEMDRKLNPPTPDLPLLHHLKLSLLRQRLVKFKSGKMAAAAAVGAAAVAAAAGLNFKRRRARLSGAANRSKERSINQQVLLARPRVLRPGRASHRRKWLII